MLNHKVKSPFFFSRDNDNVLFRKEKKNSERDYDYLEFLMHIHWFDTHQGLGIEKPHVHLKNIFKCVILTKYHGVKGNDA